MTEREFEKTRAELRKLGSGGDYKIDVKRWSEYEKELERRKIKNETANKKAGE